MTNSFRLVKIWIHSLTTLFTCVISASSLFHSHRLDCILLPLLPQSPVLLQRGCGEEASTRPHCHQLSLCYCLSAKPNSLFATCNIVILVSSSAGSRCLPVRTAEQAGRQTGTQSGSAGLDSNTTLTSHRPANKICKLWNVVAIFNVTVVLQYFWFFSYNFWLTFVARKHGLPLAWPVASRDLRC